MTSSEKTKKTKPRQTKTIYKKTLLKVYKYVLDHKRTEIKIAAKELNLNKESVRRALHILSKNNYVTERKYADMGISYFYPSDKRQFVIYVFHPKYSFLIIIDSKMTLWYTYYMKYRENMMPDDNLHHFLKQASYEANLDYGGIPDEIPFVAFPGKLNEKTGRIDSETIPELALTDTDEYTRELLGKKHVRCICYDYTPQKRLGNHCFYTELVMKAFDTTFIRRKKKN